jgi:hypothetical protein
MDYTALKARANALIEKHSDLSISYSPTMGYSYSYDPATNTNVWYKDGVPSEPSTTYTGTCIETQINEYFAMKGYIRTTDKVFLTSAFPVGVVPQAGETIIVDDVTYKVLHTTRIKPSNTEVLLKITARKS